MAQAPDQIREQIEETRERMSGTAQALAEKANVPKRVKRKVTGAKDVVVEKAGSGVRKTTGAVSSGVRRTGEFGRQNPMNLALISAAGGFAVGLLLPRTQKENEKIGPAADQVKARARETAQEAVQRGTVVAQRTAQAAVETAKSTAKTTGQQQKEALKETAEQKAQQAAASTKRTVRKAASSTRSSTSSTTRSRTPKTTSTRTRTTTTPKTTTRSRTRSS